MKTAIQQWGNSLALRISKAFGEQAGLNKGTIVRLTLEKGRMVVAPLRKEEISLKKLLAKVTRKNVQPETDWGVPLGKEI